jgi:hypothetical protein
MSASWRGRLRVERFEDGAVVLDRETGRFFRASAVAARIAEALARGLGVEEIVAELAARFEVRPDRVEADVQALVATLDRPVARTAANAVSFRASAQGLWMSVAGREVARLSPDGRAIDRLGDHDGAGDREQARALVRLALPHALTLQGVTVLHASAVHVERVVHAFSGPSGAGKTTLAAALVAAGAAAESEDLVVLVPDAPSPTVACGAEAWLRAWVDTHAGDTSLEVPTLGALAAWRSRAPLGRVAFLEARHADARFAATPLERGDVCARLLANAFAETERPDVFDACLRGAATIARAVSGVGLRVPGGLEALEAAACRDGYNSITRS